MLPSFRRETRTPTTTPSSTSDQKTQTNSGSTEPLTVAAYKDLVARIALETAPIGIPISQWPLHTIYIRHALTSSERSHCLALVSKATKTCEDAKLDERTTALRAVLSPAELETITRIEAGPLVANFFPGDGEPAVYPIETRHFRGKLIVRLVGFEQLTANAPGENELRSYFAGRKRVMQFLVQGSFKERLAFADVLTGQIFQKQLNLPTSTTGFIFCKMGLLVLRAFSSSLIEDMVSKTTPFFLSPLISSYQTVHVTAEGQVPPDISKAGPLEEDMSFHGSQFRKGHSRDRQRYFGSCAARLNQFWYEPNVTYTFESYQHQFRFEDFMLRTPMKEFSIASYLNRQPIELMALIVTPEAAPPKNPRARLRRVATGECPSSYLWRLQIFHRDNCNLNQHDH